MMPVRSLEDSVRSQISRCACRITFRFGNEVTLTSSQALVIPIGNLRLKIAVVPGGTPFLIRNTLMRAIHAQVDCHKKTLSSAKLSRDIPLELTPKGLFLLGLNELVKASRSLQTYVPQPTKLVEETSMACENAAALPRVMSWSRCQNHPRTFPKSVIHRIAWRQNQSHMEMSKPTSCSEPSAQGPAPIRHCQACI